MAAHLDDQTITTIHRYCARGDLLAEEGRVGAALDAYWSAWDLLPEPRTSWPVSVWILGAIGEVIFRQGNYQAGHAQFVEALDCAHAEDALAQIRLRLGQCRYELGDMDGAAAELGTALRLEGPHLFADEHPKYLAFLRGRQREAARG